MASLELKENGHARWVKLDKPQMRIGRGRDCDIRLDESNLNASRNHAQVKIDGDVVYLIDLNSKSGTHVGSVKVTEVRLSDGDAIRIGSTTIIFHSSDDAVLGANNGGSARNAGNYETTVTVRRTAVPEPVDLEIPLAPAPIPVSPALQEDRARPGPVPSASRRSPKRGNGGNAVETIVWLQWLLKTAAVLAIVVAIPVGIWWYNRSASEEVKRLRAEDDQKHASLVADATKEVEKLLETGEFHEAKKEVGLWQSKGLKPDFAQALTLKVDRSQKDQSEKYLAKAQNAVDTGRPDEADDWLSKAKELGYNNGSRLNKLSDRIANVKKDESSRQGIEEMLKAFTLLKQEKYTDARRTKDAAIAKMNNPNDRGSYEKEFREKLGAVLRIGSLPSGAWVVLDGYEQEKLVSGQLKAGLSDGPVTGVAYCSGYVSHPFSIPVKYPNEETLDVQRQMTPEAQPEIWALYALTLAKQDSRTLVSHYYQKTAKKPSVKSALKYFSEMPLSNQPRPEGVALGSPPKGGGEASRTRCH